MVAYPTERTLWCCDSCSGSIKEGLHLPYVEALLKYIYLECATKVLGPVENLSMNDWVARWKVLHNPGGCLTLHKCPDGGVITCMGIEHELRDKSQCGIAVSARDISLYRQALLSALEESNDDKYFNPDVVHI